MRSRITGGHTTIRRFSIAKAMVVIALVAANCAAVRACFAEDGEEQFPRRLLGGLLPLANAQIIWLYLVARRYRISLRWRAHNWRGRCVVVFGMLNALAIVLLTAACILAPLPVAKRGISGGAAQSLA